MADLLRELAVDLFATVVGITVVGLPMMFITALA